ncbi:MAG: ATP-binding protein [Gammaproteobacteria bacterium]|nr:ATP-binding protein [Gammaproteobacteria bacterium]MBV8306400.1 ATP-binding protein [Gammaproteobacteria bacterium]MBV8403824.1 ATP-binding protein [Gammaproteobacteria bacterium]
MPNDAHAARIEIRFPGTHAGFAQGFLEARQALDAHGLAGGPRYNAELVFEEITANIVCHGSPDGHALEVWFTLEDCGDAIVLTFEDNGVPFDPRTRPDPPRQKSLEEARIGGYGLMLVRHAATSIDYLRTAAGRNRTTVRLPHP